MQANQGIANILVIDDHEMFREAVADILELDNITVTGASNGQTGINLFTQQPELFQMILLDVNLPDMPGSDVVGHLKRVKNDTPIVVSSGHSRDYIFSQANFRANDVAGHLPKPFDMVQLRELVQNLI